MPVGTLHLHLQVPGCTSLKEKRGRVRPLLARLHREFNVSASELDHLDSWQEAGIGCAVISNDSAFNQRLLEKVKEFIEGTFPDLYILQDRIELI